MGYIEESNFCMGIHTGTHIDAPAHFIKGGKMIDQLDLGIFYGECLVIDLSGVDEVVKKSDLESALERHDIDGSRVLLKTSNSLLSATGEFYEEFVYLSVEGAEYLVDRGVKLIRIDFLSIERGQPDHPTHKALLVKDIPIVEGLRLARVEQVRYTLSCFPLGFVGTEAAPCRAVLF